ncbi:MAG: ADP-ribosylglycohydrolase family protein [Anaerolineae bacterium]|nr:ADP-ribosylglycohydrolase family protein [Anaerolineae bacterium]
MAVSQDIIEARRRARGSLLGAAIGDAMGAPCEGMSSAAIREKYGVITGFLSEDAVGTDDTDFTLFNAHLLLTYGVNITLEQVEREWRDKLLSGRYYYRPGGFSDVVSTRNLTAGLHAPQSGSFNHQMWSDGVAMAISAAGILSAGKPDQAARLATVLGSVSNARDGIYCAQAVAAAISVGMIGASPAEMVAEGVRAVPADSWTRRVLDCLAALPLAGLDLESALPLIEQHLVVPWWPWADLVTEAVPVAFAVFLACGGEFQRAVPAGVRLGRDADTIAAIVGSLSGAYGGEDAIPDDWQRRVYKSTGKCIGFVGGMVITEVADQLVEQGGHA